MADILRVTSPVINKNIIQPDRAQKDPSVPFDMQEIRHITKNPSGSALLGQHNVFQKEAGAATLMNLLKDPAVTVNYLKNIYMLEEIISLLPVNNNTMTQEIRQLFHSLLINPDDIVGELVDQEYASTLFKGPLFDFLRNLLYEKPELRLEMADFLKAVNGSVSRNDVLDSVANSLEYLSSQLAGSRNLTGIFGMLSDRVRTMIEGAGGQRDMEGSETGEAGARQAGGMWQSSGVYGRGSEIENSLTEWEAVKADILDALKELENSILFSPQTERMIPNLLYNMSRYQDNESYLQEALLNLLIHVNSREDKDQLKSLLKDYVNQFSSPEYRENRSRIMDTLAEIIRKQDRETPMNSLNGEKIEKIITSLLSSPCNYTPLLHFVIPVEYQGMKAFSELWIDPKDEGGSGQERDGEDHVHVLITFDIPGIGQMEAEFQVAGREMEFYLYCPESYAAVFGRLTPDFRKIMEEYGYHAAEVEVSGLDHVRSLMDVFKNLPYRRTGVDVKI